jgi:hypothetical protein
MILDARIQGIPCQVRVTYYRKEDSPILTGPMDHADPGSPVEIEFQVLDRRGKRAEWLESKVTDEDRDTIEREIITEMAARAAEDRAEARSFHDWGAYA